MENLIENPYIPRVVYKYLSASVVVSRALASSSQELLRHFLPYLMHACSTSRGSRQEIVKLLTPPTP